MIAVLKVVVTLALIVVLLNRKIKMGNAMLAGSTVLFLLSEPSLNKLSQAAAATFTSHSTWEIILALYFVMCLEYQLRTGGIIDGLMSTARRIFRSDRILLAMMPAFLGFLPSLGGAIFSAPLVESAGKGYILTAEAKTTINYWFRHVWEFTNPIFTAMLLASQLSNIPLSVLIANMAWVTILSIAIGWVFLILPLKNNPEAAQNTDGSTPADISWRYIALAAGPVLANFLLVVFFRLNAYLSMGLVVAAMIFILRQDLADIGAMLAHAFDRKLLWGIVGILFFQNILRQSGAINDISLLLNNFAIPTTVIIGIIAFLGGILTGTSQGFVAISFPFIAVLSPGNVSLAMISFVMGTAGQMLSPAHLCLLVTLDYFKADFLKSLRPVLALEVIMMAAAYGVVSVIG